MPKLDPASSRESSQNADERGRGRQSDTAPPQKPSARTSSGFTGLFSIPAPVKMLFDRVPLVVYDANGPPQRAPREASLASLYIFSTDKDAAAGRPSFNPSCLKWQTFLNIAGINHRLVASNNHASPSGSLPFLLPAATSNQDPPLPVTSNKLVKYVREHGGAVEESSSLRYEAYQSLLDHRIRHAWLYTLYLEPANFASVAHPLYVAPCSSSILVQTSISHQLRTAAEAELLRYSSIIDAADLYSEADKAFEALSSLLGEDEWFFGNDKPALFDASIFAYTQLLLDKSMGWKDAKLQHALKRRENLVRHRERLLVRYYGRP